MARKRNFEKLRYIGKQTEVANPKEEKLKGPATNIKREPCRRYTAEEIEQWKQEHMAPAVLQQEVICVSNTNDEVIPTNCP